MDSRVTPGYGHNYDEPPHNQEGQIHSTVIGEGGGEHDHLQDQQQQPHEKKSVLKKVKAKAKKIKDTLGIKKHEHEHEHGHEHEHRLRHEDDEYLDDEEDEDDEFEQEPEVHGAPMYETEAASKFVEDKNVNSNQPKVHFGQMPDLEPDSQAPKGRFGTGTANPGNYQTKVTDPTGAGGKEVDVEPVIRSFGKMDVTSSDDQDSSNWKSSTSIPTQTGIGNTGITGSHDQFSPDYSSIPTQNYPIPEERESIPEAKHQETNIVGEHQPTNQSSYTEKLSTATYAIADKAISAKNVVASKLGYGAGSNDAADKSTGTGTGTGTGPTGSGIGAGTIGYGKQVASAVTDKLAPVYEKVAGAGSAVVSKVSGTGTGQGGPEGPDKGVSMKAYLSEKFRPSEEDKALSEVISGALHKRNEDEDHSKKVQEAMGRVTESEEVAKRLGTDDNAKSGSGGSSSGVIVGGGSGSGVGMVDRMRGTVASWFGNAGNKNDKTAESQSPSSDVDKKRDEMIRQTRHEGIASNAGEDGGQERRPTN